MGIKVGNIKHIVDKDKCLFIEILDGGIIVQNIIEDYLCPTLLRILIHLKKIIFETYYDAKIIFGALIFKEGKNINAKIDYKTFDIFVKYTERFSLELLI